ncbi:MAG: cupin domain-containing protein [Acidobacteriota bacterium]
MAPVETFADLIAPVSAADFFRNHWEKTYLHCENAPDRFAQYFSVDAMDRWMASVRSGPSNSILFKREENGERKTDRYRPEELRFGLAYEALSRGSSVVLNQVEDYHSVAGLAKSLAADFHATIGVNAYFTPPNAKTFPIHTDEHDVLVLHLHGEKVWHIHDLSFLQVDLPQKQHLKLPAEWYQRTETPEIAKVRLTPGDLLYLPRGMPHYAVATDSACLHLTVSITPLYWMDVLKIATEHVAARSEELRRVLPPGFVAGSDEEQMEQMRRQYQEARDAFLEHATFDDVLAAVRRNRVTHQSFPADGHLEDLLHADELTPETRVERRQGVLCVVDEILDPQQRPKATLFFGQQRFSGPPRLRRSFEFIRDRERFSVSEIPGLDANGQVMVAKRLVKDGLLRLASSEG